MHGVTKRHVRRTTLISVSLVLFLAGAGFVRIPYAGHWLLPVTVAIALLVTAWIRNRPNFGLFVVLCTGAFLLGVVRGNTYMQKLSVYGPLYKQQVTIKAVAKEDSIYSERKQLVFSASHITVLGPKKQQLVGNIEIEGFGALMVYRGDEFIAKGKLYPKRGDNQAGISFAEIQIIKHQTSLVDGLRRRFTVGLQNTLPEPLASFALGLLIGQRNTLPKTLQAQLTTVGLVHIVAVSGYNLTIIINVSQAVFKKRSRLQSLFVSVSLISIFLLLTGNSPSIVRAAVVSGISLITWYYGRKVKPVLLLLLSAALTVAVYPIYIWSSIGWYLSFTAFFGVLVLSPLLLRLVKARWQENIVAQVLSETTAAQICTLPLILFIFARLSVVSLFANVLVIPLVPLAMLTSLIAGVYGMIGPILFGGLLVIPARILLQYMLGVVGILSEVPHASVIVSVTVIQMLLLYFVILFGTLLLWRASRRKLTSDNKEPIF